MVTFFWFSEIVKLTVIVKKITLFKIYELNSGGLNYKHFMAASSSVHWQGVTSTIRTLIVEWQTMQN